MAPVQVELEARDTVRRLEGEALLGVQLPVVLSVFEKRSRREYFADSCCLAWQVPVAARHPGTKTPFALEVPMVLAEVRFEVCQNDPIRNLNEIPRQHPG